MAGSMVDNRLLEQSLQGLKRATGPRIVSPDQAPFEPDELAVRQMQMQDPVASNLSREDIGAALNQRLRNAFGLKVAESEQAIRQAIAPREVEGQYRVKAAEVQGRQRQDQFDEAQRRLDARQERQLASTSENQRLNREAIGERMQAGATRRGVPVGAREQLAKQRAAIEKQGKAGQGFFDSWKSAFGIGEPDPALAQFDNMAGLAQTIVTNYPDDDLDTALQLEGQDALSEDEKNQLAQMVFTLRGR